MKALIAHSAATVLSCLCVLVGITMAQGEGYTCDGPLNMCTQAPCASSSGNCPDVPSIQYVAYSDSVNMNLYNCIPATGTCYPSELIHNCTNVFYEMKTYLGICTLRCGMDYNDAYTCSP